MSKKKESINNVREKEETDLINFELIKSNNKRVFPSEFQENESFKKGKLCKDRNLIEDELMYTYCTC